MVTRAGDKRAIEGDPLENIIADVEDAVNSDAPVQEKIQVLASLGLDASTISSVLDVPEQQVADALPEINTLPATPPVSAPTQTNDASADDIRQLYKSIFGRDADEAGLKYWDETGLGAKDIENEFRKSQEFGETKDASADQIRQLYKDVLGREADEAGLKYWDETGANLQDIRKELGKSQEFGETKDASADQIKSLYKDMFGREADEAGLKYWDETGANLQDIRKEFAKSAEGKDLGVEDLAAKSYAKPEDKTFYESFDVNKDKYMSPAEQAAFKKATDTVVGGVDDVGDDFKVGQAPASMRGDRTGTGVSVTGENSGLREPYVDYVQRMLERASAEADVPFQAYTKTPELITQATSGLKNLVTPGQFTSGSNLAQAAGLGALMYGNYQPTQYATGTFSNPFVQGQQPPGKAMGGEVRFQTGGDVNVGTDSSQQSPYTNMNYGMGNLQPMQYGGQNVTNVQASYMDPYTQNVTNIAKREAQRASDIAGQREAAQAVSQGAFGGSRYGLVEAERQRNLGQQMSDLDIKGLQAAYQSGLGQFNTEQDRALRAQQLGEASRQFGADLGLRGLDTSLRAASTLGNLGQQQSQADLARLRQQYDTGAAERTFDYNEFLRSEKYPYENLRFMREMLQGLPVQAASTGISPNTEAILAALSVGSATKPGT
jgi:hypothetical protein